MTARRTACALLVALVAAGILGMHVLGLHGAGHEADGPAGGAVHAAVDAPAPAVVAPAPAVAAHDHGDRAPDAADSTAMACLLLLTLGALVVLLAPLLRRFPGGGLTRLRTIRPAGPRPEVDRASRPPPVWRYSVIRC